MQKSNTTTAVRTQNLQLLYHFVRCNGPVSKQDIHIALSMSLPTITQNLRYLDAQGLLNSSKSVTKKGGRNAIKYSHNASGRLAIGVYLSGSHITAVCVDLSGAVVQMKRIQIRFNLDDDSYLRRLGELIEQLCSETILDDKQFLGVGIALPSLLSENEERVIFGYTYNFTGKTRSEITRYIPYPTRIYHDSYVAGFAEVWLRPDINNAVYFNLNNSIGGSIIINNHVYAGDNNRSGEIGHIHLQSGNSRKCYCGQTGCFDTFCNAGVLDSYTSGDLPGFFELLENHDSSALSIWQEYLKNLAEVIHNTRMLLDCSIILGGYVGAFMEDYMDELCSLIDAKNIFQDHAADYVLPCKYKTEATAAGAALSIINDFINNIDVE